MNIATNIDDYEAITTLIQHYIKVAISGERFEMTGR